jgi:hypothetical protein
LLAELAADVETNSVPEVAAGADVEAGVVVGELADGEADALDADPRVAGAGSVEEAVAWDAAESIDNNFADVAAAWATTELGMTGSANTSGLEPPEPLSVSSSAIGRMVTGAPWVESSDSSSAARAGPEPEKMTVAPAKKSRLRQRQKERCFGNMSVNWVRKNFSRDAAR